MTFFLLVYYGFWILQLMCFGLKNKLLSFYTFINLFMMIEITIHNLDLIYIYMYILSKKFMHDFLLHQTLISKDIEFVIEKFKQH